MSHTRLLNGCPFIYLGAMRALLFAALLVLVSGCHKNHELFRSYQDELDRRLSAMKLRADHFNETRKAVDALEREVTQGLVELPAAREQLAGFEDLPTTASPLAPLPPLPPGSVFEGPDGERLRLRIAD